MAATLTASVSAGVSWVYTSGGTPASNNSNAYAFSRSLTNGTGAINTADLIYAATGTITASNNTTVDLVGGSTDFFGTTITMARLKYLYVENTNDTTSTGITVGNATNPINLFSAPTATHTVGNGGIFLMGNSGATGIAMTGAASDTLKLLNADGANSATYHLCAIGSSA